MITGLYQELGLFHLPHKKHKNKIKETLRDFGMEEFLKRRIGELSGGQQQLSLIHILQDLGIKKLRLMTNNPTKIDGLNEYGLEIVERVPIQMPINPFDKYYMQTKQKKMGHMTTYEV